MSITPPSPAATQVVETHESNAGLRSCWVCVVHGPSELVWIARVADATKLVTDMLIERNVGADPLAATLDVQVTPSPLRITAPPAPTATNRRWEPSVH